MDPFFQRLKERKLVQWTIAYLAGAWVLYEVVDTVGDRWGLPDVFFQGLFVLLVIGFVVALVLAWYHGEKGRQRVSGPELLLLALLLVIAGTGISLLRGGEAVPEPTETATIATEEDDRPAIAALPFENLSGNPDDLYFADGMHEEVLTHLSRVGDLKVISRTSVMEYRDRAENIRTIAAELGVTHILEATVRRAAGTLRITVQLIDARNDAHVWSEIYDRDYTAEAVFTIQSDVAARIVEAVGATLSPETRRRIETRPTENLTAYETYLQAQNLGQGNNPLARVDLLRSAVRLDPDFALAHAALATAEARVFWYGIDRREERLELAKAAADRALALDPTLPEGHIAMAYYHYWGRRDYERALESMARAEEGLAGSATLFSLRAAIERRQGDFEGAARDFARSFELNPRSAMAAGQVGQTLEVLGRYEEAMSYYDRVIELSPTDDSDGYESKAFTYRHHLADLPAARRVLEDAVAAVGSMSLWREHYEVELFDRRPAAALNWALRASDDVVQGQYGSVPLTFYTAEAHHRMGEAQLARTQFDSARVVLEEMVRDQPENETAPGNLAWVYARLGRKEDAIRMAQRGVQLMPVSRDAYIGPFFILQLAHVYAAVDEIDAAIGELEQLASLRGTDFLALHDPRWDPIRDDPRFHALLEKYADDVEH